MRSLSALIVALVLVALAGTAWYFTQNMDRPVGATEVAQTGPMGTEAPLTETDSTEVEIPTDQKPTESRESVESSLAPGIPNPAATASKGSDSTGLRGVVLASDGSPVVGAQVRAHLDQHFWRFMSNQNPTTTDAEGRFEFRGLNAGANRLGIEADGFAPFTQKGIAIPKDEILDLGTLTLEQGVRLAGQVVDHLGRPVEGAVFSEHEEGNGFIFSRVTGANDNSLATSDADGRFEITRLSAGPFALMVDAEAHPSHVERGETERPGDEFLNLTIQLREGAEIAGRVEGLPSDRSATDFAVVASRSGEDNHLPFDFLGMRSARVDEDQNFVVRGLEVEQAYSLQLMPYDENNVMFGDSLSSSVIAASGDRSVVLTHQRESVLTFKVVDAKTNKPIEKMSVSAGIDWARPVSAEGQVSNEFPGGLVRAEELRPEAEGEVVILEIEAVGYRSLRRNDVRLLPGQSLDLGTIALSRSALVKVQVLDQSTGALVSKARVTLSKAGEGGATAGGFSRSISFSTEGGSSFSEMGEQEHSGRTDSEGWVTLNSFEGSDCTLGVKADGYAPKSNIAVSLPVGRDYEQEVMLSTGGKVLVTVLDENGEVVAGKTVQHRSPSEGGEQRFPRWGRGGDHVTNTEGQVLFTDLEPGEHSFQVAPDSSGGSGVFSSGGAAFAVMGGEPDREAWESVQVSKDLQSELSLVAPTLYSLIGKVTEQGNPLIDAKLSVRKKEEGGARGGSRFTIPGFGGGPETKTDSRGEYSIENLESGDYTLTITHTSRAMSAEFEFSVDGSNEGLDVDLDVTIVEGQVTDSEGKGLAGVMVSIQAAGGGASRTITMFSTRSTGGGSASAILGGDASQALTDSEGNYSLRGVTPGTLIVKGEGQGLQPCQSEPFDISEGQLKRGVDLQTRVGASLDVSVVTAAGDPATMCLVQASFLGEGEGVQPVIKMTGDDGKVSLEGLTPGPWGLSASDVRGGSLTISSGEYDLEAEAKEGEALPVELVLKS